jgi:hypothetical protein
MEVVGMEITLIRGGILALHFGILALQQLL